MSRIRIKESLYHLGPHHPGLQAQETCLRAVVQLLRVVELIHPARIRRSVSSDRFGFSATVPPKYVKKFVWRYCCPMALKAVFVAGARGIGMHMIYALLSEMVRPNGPKTSTKTATIRPSPRGDRDTMHASSAYNIPKIARRTCFSAVSGPIFDGCSCRCIRSASRPASLLDFSSATRSIAAKKRLNSSGEVRIPDGAPVPPRTTPSIGRHYSASRLSPIV